MTAYIHRTQLHPKDNITTIAIHSLHVFQLSALVSMATAETRFLKELIIGPVLEKYTSLDEKVLVATRPIN